MHRVKLEDCFLYRTGDGIAVDPRNGAALLTKPSRLRAPDVWRRGCLRGYQFSAPCKLPKIFPFSFRPVDLRRAARSLLRRPFKCSRIERGKERSSGTQFRELKPNGLIASSSAIVMMAGMMPPSFGKNLVLCGLTVDLLLRHTLRRDRVEL